ncbi:MAG: UPF0280 family protein [Candidatus Thorarchaeota archaeon]
MKRQLIRIGKTIALLTADEQYFGPAEVIVQRAHLEIRQYIRTHPWFWSNLEPLEVEDDAPVIVKRMAEAARVVNVGPMATVAGAIAQTVVEHLVEKGATHVILDNGGDIAMFLDHPIVAGIYAGRQGIRNLGLYIETTHRPLGLCTSSATVGPSLSFGRTDAATVFADDVILADAAATALGNLVTKKDHAHIKSRIQQILVDRVQGAMVIIGDVIGIGGRLPRIVNVHVDENLIAKVGACCY